MQLLYFVMIVGAVLARTLAEAWPHLDASRGFLVTACLVLMSGALVRLLMVHAAILLDETGSRSGAQRAAWMYREGMNWIWAVGSPWILAGFGWGACADYWFGNHGSWTLDILFWFAPSIAFMLLADRAWYEWQSYLRGKSGTVYSDRLSKSAQQDRSFLESFWTHAKHTWLMVLLPTLGVCSFVDVTGISVDLQRDKGSWFVLGMIAFAMVLLVLPELVIRMWNARPIDDQDLLDRLSRLWKLAGGTRSGVVTWSTNHRVANAVVLGITPWRRWLLLSDLLIAKCSKSQLEVITLHEVAHIQRWHLVLRATPILVGFAIMMFAQWIMELPQIAPLPLSANPWLWVVLGGLKMILVLWLLSKVARWTEFDADRRAVELSQEIGIYGENGQRLSACEVANLLASTLQSIMRGVPLNRRTWLHPSIAERCQALHRSFPDLAEGSKQASQSEETSSPRVAPAT